MGPTTLSNAVILQGKLLTVGAGWGEQNKIDDFKATAVMVISGWTLSLENFSKEYDQGSSRLPP